VSDQRERQSLPGDSQVTVTDTGLSPALSYNLYGPATAVPGNVHPSDAQQVILAAFDKYEVVGGMSSDHGVKDVDDFIIDLIRNPSLPGKVNDIAVECGNSLYQPILDRYIAGQDVPLTEVRQVWRNTTQPSCGFSTFYEELFPWYVESTKSFRSEEATRVGV
jgi:hypothetical protein